MTSLTIVIITHNGLEEFRVMNPSVSHGSVKYDHVENMQGDTMPPLWEMSYNTEIEQAVRKEMEAQNVFV